MYILNLIENRFNDFSLKTKIELFIFPLLILILVWSLFFNNIKFIEHLDKKEFDINTLQMQTSIIDIIADIRTFCLENQIELHYLETKNKIVDVKIKASFAKQVLFINFIEEYNSFSNIEYLKQNINSLDLSVSFSKLFLKKAILKEEFKKTKEQSISKKEQKENQFRLEAIVGKKVYLNSTWLEKNQSIESYTLTDIKANYILLSNGLIKLKVRLYENNDD